MDAIRRYYGHGYGAERNPKSSPPELRHCSLPAPARTGPGSLALELMLLPPGPACSGQESVRIAFHKSGTRIVCMRTVQDAVMKVLLGRDLTTW